MAKIDGEAHIRWGPVDITIKSTKESSKARMCHKCEKMIFDSEMVYCPYCGEKLEGN